MHTPRIVLAVHLRALVNRPRWSLEIQQCCGTTSTAHYKLRRSLTLQRYNIGRCLSLALDTAGLGLGD